MNIAKAVANTWIGLTFFIWIVTEVLSIFRNWTTTMVLSTWCALLIYLLYYIYKRIGFYQIKKIIKENDFWHKHSKTERKCLLVFMIYFLAVFIWGILSGQYNMDSMVYHLPRIMHWIQNKSVWHYAPGIEFQVRYPCLTEYFVAQIYLFGASDRLANMVQNMAYIGSSIMVFGISRKIGISKKASYMAMVLYLMMPMALVQSFSTQTDNVAGLYLLTFVFLILDYISVEKLRMDKAGLFSAIKLSLTAMLGYLCKPTICFVMLTFFIAMGIVRLYKRDRWSELIKYMIIGGMVAGILFIPSLCKSYQTYTRVNNELKVLQENTQKEQVASEEQKEVIAYGNAGSALTPDVFNVKHALLDPKQFVVTCFQNLGRNSTSICFPQYNSDWEKLIIKIGGWLERDVSNYRTQVNALFFYQDTASNPWIMMLTLVIIIGFVFRICKTNKIQTCYIVCAILGFLLQCGLMGYTQYRTRYLVGAMGVLCPAIAIAVDKCTMLQKSKDILITLCIAGALVGGVNTLSYELPRVKESLEGDMLHQYFIGNPDDEYVYKEMARVINENEYTKIGIDGTLYMEYPLWKGVEHLERLESVNVSDIYFMQYEDKSFEPDCIVKVVSENEPVKEGDVLECHGISYNCMWAIHWYQSYFCVYSKA